MDMDPAPGPGGKDKSKNKGETQVPPDVVRFIAGFPSLTIVDGSDASFSQKVQCSMTGHEMPCRVAELERYTVGKKFKKALERSDQQFEKYKPHVIPSNKKGRGHQLFCTLTLRHINRVPAHVERHVNGRRYKKALQRYEECQASGVKYKPLGRRQKREEKAEGEKPKQYSQSAFSGSSESEAESEDSMSDLYPRDYFESQSGDEQGNDEEVDDSSSDFDMEDMEYAPQMTSNEASTSAGGDGSVKRKKNFQKGGKMKLSKKQQQGQRNPMQKTVTKKGTLKHPRKEKIT